MMTPRILGSFFLTAQPIFNYTMFFIEHRFYLRVTGARIMASAAILTMTKMMERLPEPAQDQVLEHLRDYISEMQSEQKWDKLFNETQDQLVAAAKNARKEIAEGKAQPMDYDRL
jgi:gamma-glutamyl:cysteine ligase YbdK (ATP-grasp superfamily)